MATFLIIFSNDTNRASSRVSFKIGLDWSTFCVNFQPNLSGSPWVDLLLANIFNVDPLFGTAPYIGYLLISNILNVSAPISIRISWYDYINLDLAPLITELQNLMYLENLGFDTSQVFTWSIVNKFRFLIHDNSCNCPRNVIFKKRNFYSKKKWYIIIFDTNTVKPFKISLTSKTQFILNLTEI